MKNLRPERGGRSGAYWFAVWTDHDGRRRRKSLGAGVKSKAAARRACNALLAQSVTDGFSPPGAAPSALAWLSVYLRQRTSYSPTTAKLYRQAVAELAKWRGDEVTTDEDWRHRAELGDATALRKLVRLDTVTRQDAAAFREYLTAGRTETTVRKLIRTLRALWAEAVRQDVVTLNPWDRQAVSTPEADPTWTYIGLEAFGRVLEHCPCSRWRAFFAISRYAGLRLNETCRLEFADIDWDRLTLAVVNPRGHRTTKHRARVVPIAPELLEILRDRLEQADPGETVVGMTYSSFSGSNGPSRRRMAEMLERAGVPDGKPHTLRKSCETDWLASHPIADVAKWLGNSPAVAMRHYHQSTDAAMAKVSRPAADAARIAALEAELEELRERV
jgi:integrase